jgi:hypothetical protein
MFCTSLRRRASFASVLPLLISSEGLKLRGEYMSSRSIPIQYSCTTENRLETHDLAIPLQAPLNTNGHLNDTSTRLRVLLLSPTSTSAANLPDTLYRIHHFAGLTGGQELIIVFLLSSSAKLNTSTSTSISAGPIPSATSNENTVHPTLAFTHLQASLLPRTDIPYIPILPLSGLPELPNLLQKHVSALSQRHQQPPTTSSNTPKPLELLQLATTEPPMDRETVYFATDCFANLRELAMACTESGVDLQGLLEGASGGFEGFASGGGEVRVATERLRELRDLVGGEMFREITDFWADEWVVE